jgi:hypothetical protein
VETEAQLGPVRLISYPGGLEHIGVDCVNFDEIFKPPHSDYFLSVLNTLSVYAALDEEKERDKAKRMSGLELAPTRSAEG